jgi:hypothetical protein
MGCLGGTECVEVRATTVFKPSVRVVSQPENGRDRPWRPPCRPVSSERRKLRIGRLTHSRERGPRLSGICVQAPPVTRESVAYAVANGLVSRPPFGLLTATTRPRYEATIRHQWRGVNAERCKAIAPVCRVF